MRLRRVLGNKHQRPAISIEQMSRDIGDHVAKKIVLGLDPYLLVRYLICDDEKPAHKSLFAFEVL